VFAFKVYLSVHVAIMPVQCMPVFTWKVTQEAPLVRMLCEARFSGGPVPSFMFPRLLLCKCVMLCCTQMSPFASSPALLRAVVCMHPLSGVPGAKCTDQ